MLKTLEEPPEHVKFILATTDPQKIPVTVLSRCLQFNLKQMPVQAIAGHLAHILQMEGIPGEGGALNLIARSAGGGSLRDALSLLDQAIAHGAGQVDEAQVRSMLGSVDQDHLFPFSKPCPQATLVPCFGGCESCLAGVVICCRLAGTGRSADKDSDRAVRAGSRRR